MDAGNAVGDSVLVIVRAQEEVRALTNLGKSCFYFANGCDVMLLIVGITTTEESGSE